LMHFDNGELKDTLAQQVEQLRKELGD